MSYSKDTNSRSESLKTPPFHGTFPDSLTKLPVSRLHIFRNFANIAYKLSIRYLLINFTKYHNILNFIFINLFINPILPTSFVYKIL